MRTLGAVLAVATAATAGIAAAAAPPVADAPGLVVSHQGRVFVEGAPVARGSLPAWSPDGSRIAYARTGAIYVANGDGSGERRLTTMREPVSFPARSPDGRTIAISASTDAYNADIFLVRADGSGLRRLTRTQGRTTASARRASPTSRPTGSASRSRRTATATSSSTRSASTGATSGG